MTVDDLRPLSDLVELGARIVKPDAEVEKGIVDDRRRQLPRPMRAWPWSACKWKSHPKALEAAKAWKRGDPNLLLWGDTGQGKTAAVMRLLRRLREVGVRRGGDDYAYACRMRWQPAKELCAVKVDSRYADDEPDIVWRSRRASLLVLNDIGKEREPNGLWDVLDHRYERSLPTIATSNYNVEQLMGIYSEELVRRLIECGGREATVVEVS